MKTISRATMLALSLALLATMSSHNLVQAAWGDGGAEVFTSACSLSKTANNYCYAQVFASTSDTDKAYESCCAFFIEYQT